MNLLNPLGLLGLLTLPVIIGLHLHMERNRKAVVSSMFLWGFLDQKFQGSKPRFLKISWLLVLDLFIAALLSLAFAQPQIKVPSIQGEDTQFFVLLDVSTSMLSTDIFPSRLSAAKEQVYYILDSLEGSQTVVVITVGAGAEVLGDTGSLSIEALKERVQGVAGGDSAFDLRLGLSLIENIADKRRPVGVHIITDGANAFAALDDFLHETQWHFVGEKGNNQAVTNLELTEIASGEYLLYAELMNFSQSERNREIRVIVDGLEVSRREIVFAPESSVPYILSLHGDITYAKVELLGSDFLAEDDFAGAGWVEVDTISVALVANNPAPLDRAVNAVGNSVLEVIPPEQYSYSANYDVTIFRNYLPEEWPSGVVMVFDPPTGSELLQVQGMQAIGSDVMLAPNSLTHGLDFSGVRWDKANLVSGWEDQFASLISDQTGVQILLGGELDRGSLYVFLAPLSLGNLTRHPAFPLLVENLIQLGGGFLPAQNYPIGASLQFTSDESVEMDSVTTPAGNEIDLLAGEAVSLNQFGRYSFSSQNYSGESTTVSFGVNGGDAVESRIRPQEWIEDYSGGEIDTKSFPKVVLDLGPWILCLVVLLILVEAWRAWR